MAAPVETVVPPKRMDCLFQVGPNQPDLHPCFLVSECIGERQKNCCARCAVICTDESRLEESVVVTSENKNILLRVSTDIELANDVVYCNGATRRRRRKVVCLNLRSVRC